jgi:nucleoside-diphosphate-sugar epimerase
MQPVPSKTIRVVAAVIERDGRYLITQRRPSIDLLKELTGFNHHWTLEQTIDDLIARNRVSGVPDGRLL